MLVELEDVDAAGIGAMWEELKFDAKHSNVSKIAVIGEETSEQVLTNIKKPTTSAETKFFKPENRDAAINWL